MRKLLVFLSFFLCISLSADPILVGVVTEFQVSPDSLERIELGNLMGGPIGPGWSIITRAGEAIIDSLSTSDEYGHLVVDSANTKGIFRLDDECDTITVITYYEEYLDTLSPVIYPSPCPSPVPLPPTGLSASLFQFYFGEDWYIDTTPTFGEPNDDYPYCIISGGVFNEDSVPIEGAEVKATFYDCYVWEDTTEADGLYSFTGVHPLYYDIIAKKDGYSPDTIIRWTRALCPAEDVNFYLSMVGIEERGELRIMNYELRIYPNPFRTTTTISLSVGAWEHGCMGDTPSPPNSSTPLLKIYTLTGRLIRTYNLCNPGKSVQSVVWDGRDESGRIVPSGIYFVRLDTPTGSLSLKVAKLM